MCDRCPIYNASLQAILNSSTTIKYNSLILRHFNYTPIHGIVVFCLKFAPIYINQIVLINLFNVFVFFIFELVSPFISCHFALELTSL